MALSDKPHHIIGQRGECDGYADERGTPVRVLLSGGIDSTACVEFFSKQVDTVGGIFIDYGQAAALRERQAASAIARHYDVPLSVYEWRGGQIKGAGEIVGRNAFLVFASVMESGGSRVVVATGLHSGTPYYDCSEEFLSRMQEIAEGYSAGCIRIATPFIRWSKRDIWEYCRASGVPLDLTYSCERGADRPCGVCLSCRDTEALRALQNDHDPT